MKVGVVIFPGSLDDGDAIRAVGLAGGTAVKIWHESRDIGDIDALILPGGFSFGDYLRSGAIAARSPVMSEVIDRAKKGVPVLGICNGFQILVESGLLPGGLIRNKDGKFICRDQKLKVENNSNVWMSGFADAQEVTIPLKSGEGGFIADSESLRKIEDEGLVTLRYHDSNPNGSSLDIAGLSSANGRIMGLMPHPEHAVELGFGPDLDEAMKSGQDGLIMFRTVVEMFSHA